MTDGAQRVAARLAHLRGVGVLLVASGDRLSYQAPSGSLSATDREWIVANRDDVLAALRSGVEQRPVTVVEQQVSLLHLRAGGGNEYVLDAAFRLRGKLDVAALQGAVDLVVARHAAARAVVHELDGRLQLVARADVRVPVQVCASAQSTLAVNLAELLAEPFDLSEPSLYRVAVLRIAADEHVVTVSAHHVVADDVSVRNFCVEMLERYVELASGVSPVLLPESGLVPPPTPWRDDPARRALVLARREALRDAPPMRLPGGGAKALGAARSTRPVTVTGPGLAAWQSLRRAAGVTTFALVVAMVGFAVRSAGGPADQLIGTSWTGRDETTRDALGYLARPGIVRVAFAPGLPFQEYLRAVAADLSDAELVGDVPVGELVGPRAYSDHGGMPLFVVAYAPPTLPAAGSLTVTPEPVPSPGLRHDLRCEARIGPEITVTATWRSSVVDGSFAEDFVGRLRRLSERPPSAHQTLAAALAELTDDGPAPAPPEATSLSAVADHRRSRRRSRPPTTGSPQ